MKTVLLKEPLLESLGPALLLSILVHAAAAGSLLLGSHHEIRMAGAPVVSVSIIDAVEAHRPRPMPKPVVKKLPSPKPDIKPPEKIADDPMESVASLSAAVQATVDTEPVSEARFNADYLHNPKPQYPGLSRRLGEEGRVLLHVQVSMEGLPIEVIVKNSSGFKRLDEAAVDVVKRWQFVSAKRGAVSLVSWVDVPLQFSLIER